MRTITFEDAVHFVLRQEGHKYVNDEIEQSRWGIRKKNYPHLDIEHLKKEKAVEIYHDDYWRKMKCHEMFAPLNLFVFDAGVNCGQPTSAMWLQEEINNLLPDVRMALKVDEIVGPVTLGTLKFVPGFNLIMALLFRRNLHYIGLRKKYPDKFAGWMQRMTDLYGLVR